MKRKLMIFSLGFALLTARGQGIFTFVNLTHTRIGSIDGPVAGTNIFGQMLAGAAPDSLSPVGVSVPHFSSGAILDGLVEVPGISGIPPNNLAYVQMVA